MNENPVTPPQPTVNPNPQAIIQPVSADLQPATINVPPVVTQPAPVFLSAPPEPVQEWKSKTPRGDGAMLGILLAGVSLVFALVFFTFGLGWNTWLKLVLMLVSSGGGMFFGLKAYKTNNQNSALLVSIIIATILGVMTLIVGASTLYITQKINS